MPTGRPLDNAAPEHGALKSAHARYAAYAAAACGYAFRSLDGADGYLFEVRDGARVATFAAGAGTPYALNDARAASVARDKSFCAETLRQAGMSVLPGEKFFVTKRWSEIRTAGREPEDALRYARMVAYPIFCKPLSASNGLHAEVIESEAAFADYMRRVAHEHFAILAQPYVRAAEYRVFVLNGEALFSYRKSLPQVTGDGRSTVGELIRALPRDPDAPPLLARDERGHRLSLEETPTAGAKVTLEGPANRSAGGAAHDLRDGAAPALARVALAATATLGLRLAGVDMFDLDGEPCVIEVNSNPMIATLEENNRWDLIDAIWRANFDAAFK